MKRVRSLIFALAVAALSLPALAQEGHHAQPGGFSAPPVPFNMTSYPAPTVTDAHGNQTKGATAFIGPVINFVLLMVLGYMALRRSINPALAARRAAIETEIAEAQRMHTEAESMHQEYADKLARLDDEIARLKADFTRAGETERDRIVADASEVVAAAPDIIIGSWCGKKFRPEQVAARPGWHSVPAVRDGELHEVKSPLILQPGPAALTDGLDRLHAIIATWALRHG